MKRTTMLLIFCLAGCAGSGVRDTQPEVIEVLVETPADIPTWAKSELPAPQPESSTVYGTIRHRDRLLNFIDVLLCHRRLLREMEAGPVNPETCEK